MKLADPRLWLALLSTALVVGLFMLDLEQPAPGPLSSVHGIGAALTGSGRCVACHGERGQSMAAACTACHVAIGEQLASGTGLHGTRGELDVRRCARCHVEHHGDDLPLVDERAFARAGFADHERFDHAHVDYTLAGRHAELTCEQCHANAAAEQLDLGQKRYLGLEQRCASCHEDPHEGRLVQGCAECHGQEQPFVVLAEFEHTDSFPLSDAHARLRCTDCHAVHGEYAVDALGGAGPRPCPRDCRDCHPAPHTDPFLLGVAALVGIATSASCIRCHSIQQGSFSRERVAMPRELHTAAGFALELPHERASCELCHALPGEVGQYGERYPARQADDCDVCHLDPHGAQFERDGAPQRCLDCHVRERFAPPSFELAAHACTAFALEGRHAAVECNRCHERAGDAPREFRGTPTRCSECHEDAHRGVLAELEPEADCSACHAQQSFAVAELARFEHERWTGFALTGRHANAACEACHVPARAELQLERRLGFAAGTRCEDCHADPHAGQFALASPAGAATDCECCHDDTGEFELVGFDHTRDSRYALDVDHEHLDCSTCHVPWPIASGELVIRYKPLGMQCADCHGTLEATR